MSSLSAITRHHLDRLALIYLRQSTPMQVREHRESTARQYGLADEAIRLGWGSSAVLTIDADLGHSARAGSRRAGFAELVQRVCLGEVGAIFGLEISRLARSCADLQRLLEFCSITDTLIIDPDGVYDLRHINDRLIVGLKEQMAVVELHVLASRLQESKRAAARRGELRLPLPVGYVYDADGHTVLDPDGTMRTRVGIRPAEDAAVLIRDHHLAYASWETFVANRQRLADNSTRRGAHPPREGTALLQGIILCGTCGRSMTVSYSHGRPAYHYHCL